MKRDEEGAKTDSKTRRVAKRKPGAPEARPMKFSTVVGACSGMSCTVNDP